MKICDEVETNEYPSVVAGDLVEVDASPSTKGVYLVCNNCGTYFLYCVADGGIWSNHSLWGETLTPKDVKVVTGDYCLKKIG